MLGRSVDDPDGIEGLAGRVDGLAHLDVETVLAGDKKLTQVTARSALFDTPVSGYEINIGRTDGADRQRPLLTLEGRAEGAMSASGQVSGTYIHGIFADNDFRRAFLDDLASSRGRKGQFAKVDFDLRVDAVLDELAANMAENLDMSGFARIAGL